MRCAWCPSRSSWNTRENYRSKLNRRTKCTESHNWIYGIYEGLYYYRTHWLAGRYMLRLCVAWGWPRFFSTRAILPRCPPQWLSLPHHPPTRTKYWSNRSEVLLEGALRRIVGGTLNAEDHSFSLQLPIKILALAPPHLVLRFKCDSSTVAGTFLPLE